MAENGKAEKFKELAEKRVTVAIDRIRRLHYLSRKGSYQYQPGQVEKMFATLRKEIDEVEATFYPKPKEPEPDPSFRFD
jgi:hypothetical protein